MDPSKGLFRRRPSNTSTHSRLRAQSSNTNTNTSPSPSTSTMSISSIAGATVVAAQSCPTSPKHSPLQRRSVGTERIPEDEVAHQLPSSSLAPTTSSEAAEYAAAIVDARREQRQQDARREQRQPDARREQRQTDTRREQRQQQLQLQRSPSRQSFKAAGKVNSMTGTERVSSAGSRRETAAMESNGSAQLQRSASTISGFGVRPRSSPAGLHAYTAGSVPSSVHGSRVDLREIDKGSAIYLGCTAPRASTLSITSSRGSSGGSAPPSPCHTPPSSPRHGIKRSTSLAKKLR